jgi:hypothetical protein
LHVYLCAGAGTPAATAARACASGISGAVFVRPSSLVSRCARGCLLGDTAGLGAFGAWSVARASALAAPAAAAPTAPAGCTGRTFLAALGVLAVLIGGASWRSWLLPLWPGSRRRPGGRNLWSLEDHQRRLEHRWGDRPSSSRRAVVPRFGGLLTTIVALGRVAGRIVRGGRGTRGIAAPASGAAATAGPAARGGRAMDRPAAFRARCGRLLNSGLLVSWSRRIGLLGLLARRTRSRGSPAG